MMKAWTAVLVMKPEEKRNDLISSSQLAEVCLVLSFKCNREVHWFSHGYCSTLQTMLTQCYAHLKVFVSLLDCNCPREDLGRSLGGMSEGGPGQVLYEILNSFGGLSCTDEMSPHQQIAQSVSKLE